MIFVALAHAADWKELRPRDVQASSFLRSNWNKYEENYAPTYAFDDDPRTGWVEGATGDGVGEWLRWTLPPQTATRSVRLDVWNGYQKSDKLLEANAAPRDVHIALLDSRGVEVAGLDTTLQRSMGAQSVTVPVTVAFDSVELRVRSVWAGKTYKDLVVSDLKLYVDGDGAYNAAAEAAQFAELRAWVDGRAETARFFAAQPTAYPFASSSATSSGGSVDPGVCLATLLPGKALFAELAAATPAWQRQVAASQPLPDGFYGRTETAELDAGGVTFFESAKATGRVHSVGDPSGEYYAKSVESAAHVLWADPAHTHPRLVWWSVHETGEERETYDYTMQALDEYDDAGHLVRQRLLGDMQEMEGPGHMSVREFLWTGGKVARVVETETVVTDNTVDYCNQTTWTFP